MTVIATISNRTIAAGSSETPSVAVPAQYSRAGLRMSRANWPVAGVEITLWLSYDGGQTWRMGNRAHIGPGSTSAKDPVLRDAVIGMGWSTQKPTHAKASAVSPSSFQSNVTIEAD